MKKKKKTERLKSRNPPRGFDGIEDGWESETGESDPRENEEDGASDSAAGESNRLGFDDDKYEGVIS